MIDLELLLRVPCVEPEMGFDISPDGECVAFSWNPAGQWEIFVGYLKEMRKKGVNLDELPTQVSSGPGGKFHPRYSPDSRFLAYAVDFDGGENFHIFIHELETNIQRDITTKGNATLQSSFDWSPDSQKLAFISDQGGNFAAYSYEIDSGKVSRLLALEYPAWKVRWSPDGEKVAVIVEASGIDYGTYIVSSTGGDRKRISNENGPIDAGQVCWSPDGKCLAFTSDIHGFNDIGIYDCETGKIVWVTNGGGENQFPTWSPDGRTIAFIHSKGTVSWLAVKKSGELCKLFQIERGVHYGPKFNKDGRSILLIFDNPSHPDDLWEFSLLGLKFKQLTHSLPAELTTAEFQIPEEIIYPGIDGTPIPALLFTPKIRDHPPGVLLIHGGPDWLFEMTWYPLMAHMASRGWVVLVPNYRGSTGYGRKWQEASRFDFGGVDTDDVAAGADFLRDEGLTDPNKIALTGRSHGGYLTASCMTRYPDLWAAGSAVVPFLNWFTNHKEIRADLQQWDLENFGDPIKNQELWRERSPSFFLDRIQAPLQLICSRQDVRCPISDSVEAKAKLDRMGKEAELIIYEDEGHAFLKIENIVDSETRRVDFLAKYLED
jgi:dipeptidyl aminopeptidase/acylaminoacyl peptidase